MSQHTDTNYFTQPIETLFDSTSECIDIFKRYPNTRDLFGELKDTKCGIYGISGPRKVGKTVLMKQLCDTIGGKYYSAECFMLDKNDYDIDTPQDAVDMCNEICKLVKNSVPVFVDEITAIPIGALKNMISIIRNYEDFTLFVYTGSYPLAVKELCYGPLGRGVIYELNWLTYNEYLRWYSAEVSNETLLDYMKYSCVSPELSSNQREVALTDYVKSILYCARTSYLSHTNNNFDISLINTDLYDSLLTYLCSLTKKQYPAVEEFLVNSQLGIVMYDIELDSDEKEFVGYSKSSGILLTSPWMITVFNGDFNNNITEQREAILLEYYYLLALLENNYQAGTYRNMNEDTGIIEELDLIAINRFDYSKSFAIECKAGSRNNTNRKKLNRYCKICDRGSIVTLYILLLKNLLMK